MPEVPHDGAWCGEARGQAWLRQGAGGETCHGPGEAHAKARFKAASKEGVEVGTAYVEIPDGEIIKDPSVDSCLQCHNDSSPTFKPFCYKERNAAIVHLDPRKQRSEEWHAARKCGCGEQCACVKADCSKAPAKKATGDGK